jgi:hypothetical protein
VEAPPAEARPDRAAVAGQLRDQRRATREGLLEGIW